MSSSQENNTAANNDLAALGILASALSGRDLSVAEAAEGALSWTNGKRIFVSAQLNSVIRLQEICVQCSLLAAGSLHRDVVQRLIRRPKTVNRYLALEGNRALHAMHEILPPFMAALIDKDTAIRSDSPSMSLAIAEQTNTVLPQVPIQFGSIRVKELLANEAHSGGAAGDAQHMPRQQNTEELTELADEENEDDEDIEDFASSPVGGGGGLGKLMQKMFQMVRRISGDGSPGADAPTHWSRSGPRSAVRSAKSNTQIETVNDAFGKGVGIMYPEWNFHSKSYRLDWCTVHEINPPHEATASVEWLEGYGLRKPLSRLGMGLDRSHRQRQGDDIDIDAAIESRVEMLAGAVPDEAVYIESQRNRRDLSVMILLDISGSVSQPAQNGTTVHEQQRGVAAALTTVLYEIGDRVSLYAFRSQGRSTVHMVPIKLFDENLDSRVMNRLHSLKPGAYSRLGTAIRHSTTILAEQSGTPRKLLLVLSDGLAYDHSYEPAYGAADSRQALGEARREGVACLCLSVGANTDPDALKRVFGSAAHATVPDAKNIGRVIGPLFRSALSAAEVQRRVR